MFNKILIANRGEIACRIIKTAKTMAIKTVAIYSEADKHALHTQLADEAFCVGPAPSAESYLNIQKIISIAKQARVDAIHPGYGFLSENTLFAQACADNNIVFIGPPIAAIEAMGSKSKAKQIMEKASVPLVPGYHGDKQDADYLLAEAKKIGFPVMLKAVAGGGGKGMRIIESKKEFNHALESAKREAKANFADDAMLVEKYIERPRHVEVQVFADNFDNYVHLYTRDCSIQRRHQKIIEEAPAPNLSEDLLDKIAAAAIQASKAINYRGAGTIEFLVDKHENFYFMEMNTRLQVEHPVTEMITSVDLVQWQIEVASNNKLPLSQDKIKSHGHSIEVRLYAEDPDNNFLPSIGTINYLTWPTESTNCRVDTGFLEGDAISPYYDPMLAKLIVWAESREQACKQMQLAIEKLRVIGVKTNINFLANVLTHPKFLGVNFDTNFIAENHTDIFSKDQDSLNVLLPSTALFHVLTHQHDTHHCIDPFSPWNMKDGWRMNLTSEVELNLKTADTCYDLTVKFANEQFVIEVEDKIYHLNLVKLTDKQLVIEHHGQILSLDIIYHQNAYTAYLGNISASFELVDPIQAATETNIGNNSMTAPMPGTIVKIAVEPDSVVKQGDKIIVMEAMKMEHTIYAPRDGLVKELLYNEGDMVNEGSELLIFEANA